VAVFDFSKLSKSDVLDVNETDESSARFYFAALDATGIDLGIDFETFLSVVSVTRKCHGKWQGSDERRAELEAIADEREAVAKAKRLDALAKKRDALVAAEKRDAERKAKRDEALAELREAGLL
jgi:hypothetical protein